jgi:hypothetical protein
VNGMTTARDSIHGPADGRSCDPTNWHRGKCVWPLLGVLVLVACQARAAEPAFPPSETIFPDTTVGWMSIADPLAFQESFDGTQYGKLLQDPNLEPFVKSFREQLSKAGKQRLGKLGLTLEDLGEVPGGEIAMAAIVPEEGRLATVLLVDTTGHEAETEKLLEEIDGRLLEQEAERLADYEDVIRVYRLPPEPPRAGEEADAPEPRERLVAVVHTAAALVVGDDPVQVHHVLSVLEAGRQDSLARHQNFVKVDERSREGMPENAASLRWFVDPFVFASAYKAANPPRESRKGPDYVEILARQGFDAVKSIGGSIIFGAGTHEMRHQTVVYAPPLPDRDPESFDRYDLAARMLRFPNAEQIEPPTWVPAGSSSWSAMQWDIQAAFKSAESLVDDVIGEEGVFDDVIASLKEDPDGPQIDVEADLIACLGQRVAMLSDYVEPIDIESDRLVIAIQATDPERVAATVAKSMVTDPDMQRIESHGVVIWEAVDRTMEIPKLEIETPGGIVAHADHDEEDDQQDRRRRLREKEEKLLPHSAVTVAHGHLLIASHRDILERVLTMVDSADSLAVMPDYELVNDELGRLYPGPVALRGFARSDDSIRPAYEMLKSGSMPKSKSVTGQILNSLLGDGEPGSVRDQKIDGSTLPDFELIRKYFGIGGFSMQNLEDGWLLGGMTLARPDVVAEEQNQEVASRPEKPVTE